MNGHNYILGAFYPGTFNVNSGDPLLDHDGSPGTDPNFTFGWPSARIGVMEGDSAIQAMYSVELEKYKTAGASLPEELKESIERTRADYDRWLDARYAAARGHVDAVIDPRDSRRALILALEMSKS